MLAIFRFTDRETGDLAGHITCHDRSPDCEQLRRAGYTPVFFATDHAMNYVDTPGDFERLAALHQQQIEYVGGGGIALPVQRDTTGRATFGGLTLDPPDTEHEANLDGFL